MFWKRRILLTVVLLARVLWRRRGTGSVRCRNLGWPLILALTRGSRMWRDGSAIVGSCHSASFRYDRVKKTRGVGFWQQGGSRLLRDRRDLLATGGSAGGSGGGQRAQFRASAIGSAATQRGTRSVEPVTGSEQYRRLRVGFARIAECRLGVAAALGT